MQRRAALVVMQVAIVVFVWSTPAIAAPALVAVDDAAPQLDEDADASRSGSLDLTNLTSGAVSLAVSPANTKDADCRPTLSKKAIGAAQSVSAKLTVPKKCESTGDDLEILLKVQAAEGSQDISVTASVKKRADSPDWDLLRWFFIPMPVLFVVLCVLYVVRGGYGFGAPLEYLGASYSFKDSWLSNVTVLGGGLTSLFGSADVVKSLLGEEKADQQVALATVGSALAVILIATGPIILLAARTQYFKTEAKKPKVLVEAFTVTGLLAATSVAVGGAFGQLVVGWQTGRELKLDGWEDKIDIAFWVAVVLLAAYTLTTVGQTLRSGTTKPPPTPPAKTLQIVANLRGVLTETEEVPDDVAERVVAGFVAASETAEAGWVEPRRRAAMP